MSQDGASTDSMLLQTVTRRARVSSWDVLPANQAEPLKLSVYNKGPTVVAVDARGWHNYKTGIFDSCDKDAILGHAVLAVGYGDDSGNKYWRIQNSWGSYWGEEGHIRVLRPDNEDEWCGMDRKPQEGVGCENGPDEVKVCGMCGILYDASVPQGAYIEETGAGTASTASSDAVQNSYTPWSPDAPSGSPAPATIADHAESSYTSWSPAPLSASLGMSSVANTDATTKLYTPWTPPDDAASTPTSPAPSAEFSLSNAFDGKTSSQDGAASSSSVHAPALSLATDTRFDGQATVDSVRRFLMDNEQ
jgi:hypothetical protein